MRLSKTSLAAVAALSIAGAPMAAQAAKAKATPVKQAKLANSESKMGGKKGTIVGLLAAVAVIVGIVLIADGPNSP